MTVVAGGNTTLFKNGLANKREQLMESRESHSLSRISSREYANSINQGVCQNQKLRLISITNNQNY